MTNQEYYEELCEKARRYDELLYEYSLLQQEKTVVVTEAIKWFVELLKENANNWNELTVEQIERLAKIKLNGG